MPDDHPVLTWMVEHASTTYNLFHRSFEVKDGKTPYSRHRGCEWRVSLPPFGETIEFLKGGHKFEARWHQGIFLESKTIPLRKSWEMRQVFSLCKAFEEGAPMTDTTSKL